MHIIKNLPGLSVLVGGMWINNLNYWGCNQYIIQRALGANLKTARNGILFAAFLKLLVPVIAVLPGITAFVLYKEGLFQTEMTEAGVVRPDHAYPTLLNLLPSGLKGLAFAALTAAVVASLAGKANSISTIFSLDIYKKFFHKNASEKQLVRTGRLTVVVAMVYRRTGSTSLEITRPGLPVYTGICWLYFPRCARYLLTRLLLEAHHFSSGFDCRPSYNSFINDSKIPARLDKWCIPRLSLP